MILIVIVICKPKIQNRQVIDFCDSKLSAIVCFDQLASVRLSHTSIIGHSPISDTGVRKPDEDFLYLRHESREYSYGNTTC